MSNHITLKEVIKVITKEDLSNFTQKTAIVSDLEEDTVLNELTKLNACTEMEQAIHIINSFPKFAFDSLMSRGVTGTLCTIDLPTPVQLILMRLLTVIAGSCTRYVSEMADNLERKLKPDSYKKRFPIFSTDFSSEDKKFYMN